MLRWLLVVWAAAWMAVPASGQTPGVKRGLTLELGGGYAFTDFRAGQGWPNTNGVYGSLGLNITNWLQIYADGDWQYGSIPQGNTQMYGDHIGARFYERSRFGRFDPFAEFLAGASRLDLNLTAIRQKYSENGFSFRTGGGLDLNLTRHWSVQAIEADYYRTPFLQAHQNNIWLSAGVVFTFGNREHPH